MILPRTLSCSRRWVVIVLVGTHIFIHTDELNYSINQQAVFQTKPLITEVSAGDLFDKITILEIKLERISNPAKRSNVQIELIALTETARHIPSTKHLEDLKHALLEVNKKLWDIEDMLRLKESRSEFDKEFIELARAVYITNDKRAELKRAINLLVSSRLIEEKSHPLYTAVKAA